MENLKPHRFFDPGSLRWYRSALSEHNLDGHEGLTDVEFLHERGFVVERGDRLVPTRAAVLVLGRSRYVRQVLPRLVIECQFIAADAANWSPGRPPSDRLAIEENIVQAWLALSERYARRVDLPFHGDMQTRRQTDHPPEFAAFREAVINQLVHQDYGDLGRAATVRVFRDRTVFWNPGHAFNSVDELLEPTAKEVRNPTIAAALRRIGLSGQPGTGMRAIFRDWRRLGYVAPAIRSDRGRRAFELTLVREGREGVSGGEESPPARGEPRAGKADMVTDQDDRAAADMDSDQVGQSDQAKGGPAGDPTLAGLTARQRTIVAACEVPRSLVELMELAGVSHRSHFRAKHLKPLLDAGVVRMTDPDNPRSPRQKYVVVGAGVGGRG